jgi:hypothetical protein
MTNLALLNDLANQIFHLAGLPPEDDRHVDEIVGQEDDEFDGYDVFDPDNNPDDYSDDDEPDDDDETIHDFFDDDEDDQPLHDDAFDYDDD